MSKSVAQPYVDAPPTDAPEARSALDSPTELLLRAGELLGSSLDFETTLDQIAHLLVPDLADWAAVDVVDESGAFRRIGVAHVDPRGEALLRELDRLYPIRPNEGRLRGKVVVTRRPVALYDIAEGELQRIARDAAHRDMLRELGIRSAIWLPLIARERVLGVLSAGFGPSGRRYHATDVQLMTDLARRAALAADNALLYSAVGRGERRQAAIATLGQRALAGDPLTDLMDYASQILSDMLEVPFAEVLELQPDRRRLLLVAGVGWQEGLVGRATVEAGLGSQGGYTLTKVEPVTVRDLRAETRFRPPPLLVRHNVISGLTVVIGGPKRPFGVLGAHTDVNREFDRDDVNFLQAVANVLGAAIERQRTEDRLEAVAKAEKSRAAELKAVIQSIGDGVVVCDSAGSVVLANPAAEELLGDRLALGRSGMFAAFDWADGPPPPDARQPQAFEVPLRRHAGGGPAERWIELSVYPVVVAADETARDGGTILVLRDITAARNARDVREAFLGILSHELRTPVTTIYGGSEVLARSGRNLDEHVTREIYEDIRGEADRLHRLVENLLVLSRVERQGLQLESEPVLLQRVLPRVVEGESSRWPSTEFSVTLPPGLPPVAAEETYLEQVVRNLLANGAKYGGAHVEVTTEARDDAVLVTVADRGSGFDNEEADRLFELFYRSPAATRRASGAGIGLFVSRQLIQAMRGRIWASNRPGGGAEFRVELPVFGSLGD